MSTSRGGAVDEQGLYSALKAGMIGAHTSESVLRNNLEAVRKVVEVLRRQP